MFYYIYGAGIRAKKCYSDLCKFGITVTNFIVSSKENNPASLFGIPVVSSSDFLATIADKSQVCIFVAFKFGCADVVEKFVLAGFPSVFPYLDNKPEQFFYQQEKKFSKMIDFQSLPNFKSLNIAIISPNPGKGGGGYRNIFRIAKYMHEFGHRVTMYISGAVDDAETIKKNVSEWYYPMTDIDFFCIKEKVGWHDACIATAWQTCYIAEANKEHFRKIFYLVQDFEPYFHYMGSDYFLAENTYKMGFSCICAGPWMKKTLVDKYGAETRCFQFPLDRKIYNTNYPRKKKNRNILFFGRPELPRRCFEIGINALKIYKRICPDTEIVMFGSPNLSNYTIPFEATIENYLPTLKDLARLYANADLGIIFSPTNPSLIPYEMMACGCPVVDIDVNNAITKYGNDRNNVFLLDSLPEKFANELNRIMNDKELLALHKTSGLKWVSSEFPSELEMAKIVESCITDKLRTGSLHE